MPFRPLAMSRTVRWRPEEGVGLEHLTIAPAEGGTATGGWRVRSALAGTFAGVAFGATYTVVVDAGWRTLALRVERTDGLRLALSSPETGRWLDDGGFSRPDLDGCVDVDLSATPFTNTLPIRRTGLTEATAELALDMVYVPFDTLAPVRDRQHYRALRDGEVYRFENDDRSFVADLAVDEDGLVLDYPQLFKRL